MKKFLTGSIAFALLLVPIQAAIGAEMIVKPAKVNELIDGEVISIALEKFPTKAGVYLQQCTEPVMGARPEFCNRQTQLWITNQPGGSFTPGASITMKVVAKFDAVDCTSRKCGIFARFDHTAGTDTSEDQFLPLTFAAGIVPATQTPIAVIEKQSIAKLPKTMKAGKRLALPAKTDKEVTVTYRSASPKVCSVKLNVLRGLKAGKCSIQAFAPASDVLEMLALNLTIKIKS